MKIATKEDRKTPWRQNVRIGALALDTFGNYSKYILASNYLVMSNGELLIHGV